MAVIDSHLHVWARPDQWREFPFRNQLLAGDRKVKPEAPGVAGNVDWLLEEMKQSGVAGALIVQPSEAHHFDHSYVTSVIKARPGIFVGCLLADPRPGQDGLAEMERLIVKEGYRAVRFHPYRWPEGESMANELGMALFKQAGNLKAPVGFMCFHGLLPQLPAIKALMAHSPETQVMVDHFGFCSMGDLQTESWQALLSLASYPQVHVKLSAFFRVTQQPWPYMDARPAIRKLVDTFGANRCMWGTDFPFVNSNGCGYHQAWQILEEGDKLEGRVLLSPDEEYWISSGTCQKLLPAGAKPLLAADVDGETHAVVHDSHATVSGCSLTGSERTRGQPSRVLRHS
ncbi:hypothetical protein WJX74_008819 [Apatococcus lobatus]|uniref:Amidohydrolase-related domain-containing protein n=1 Tax=Apatococcus lobatus TaxID=904363 RepID=A0AAW1S0C6_9CHLO